MWSQLYIWLYLIRIILSDYLLPSIDLFPRPQGPRGERIPWRLLLPTTTGKGRARSRSLPVQGNSWLLIRLAYEHCTRMKYILPDIWLSILYLVFGDSSFSLYGEIYCFRIGILPHFLSGFKSRSCSRIRRIWATQTPGSIYICIHMTRVGNTHWVFGPTGGLSLLWRRINLLLSWGAWTEVTSQGTQCTLEQILIGMALREDHTSDSLVMPYAQFSGHCHFILAENGYGCWSLL